MYRGLEGIWRSENLNEARDAASAFKFNVDKPKLEASKNFKAGGNFKAGAMLNAAKFYARRARRR